MEVVYIVYGELNGKRVAKFATSSLWLDSDGAAKVYHALNCQKMVIEAHLGGRHGLTMSIDIADWDGEYRADYTPYREFKEITEWVGIRTGTNMIEQGAA